MSRHPFGPASTRGDVQSPVYFKLAIPSAFLIRLIILLVAVFISPNTFPTLGHVRARTLLFNIIRALSGALPLTPANN